MPNSRIPDTSVDDPPSLYRLPGRAGGRSGVVEGGVEAHPALLGGVRVPLFEEQALGLLHAAVVIPSERMQALINLVKVNQSEIKPGCCENPDR